jgi:hypothetical protein
MKADTFLRGCLRNGRARKSGTLRKQVAGGHVYARRDNVLLKMSQRITSACSERGMDKVVLGIRGQRVADARR